jgi:hypothetical protein
MKRSILRQGSAAAIAVGFVVALSTPASAVSSTTIYSGDGDTLRAIFYEHINFTGAQLRYYGSSPCTSTTTDADFSFSAMPTGWNDVISSVRDYNQCDVKLYMHSSFGTPSTAYVNYGSTGKNLSTGWNDQVSSFRVS